MIVPSMTHAEVYAELDKDRENVARWFDHQSDTYRRKALKTQKFPVTWWLDYTSPRKNRYLLGITCTRRNYDRFHGLTVLALRREERGYTVYLNYLGCKHLFRKMVFLQHVFDRYADPGARQKTGLDLIRHFAENQSNGTFLDNQATGRAQRALQWPRPSVCSTERDTWMWRHFHCPHLHLRDGHRRSWKPRKT